MIPPENDLAGNLPGDELEPTELSQSGQFMELLDRMRRVLPFQRKRKEHTWIMMILNPASGQATPDLRLFNRMIHEAGMDWEIEVTNSFGDGARLAREAVKKGAGVVAAYGGDGTVMDVAAGMLGSDVPLAILPGGTGNALAKELLIPQDLDSAVKLMVGPAPKVRKIDIGQADDDYFLLRFGVGLEAEITRTADRAQKDRMGPLAYVSAAVQAWNQAAISRYQLEMDGKKVEIEGLACMVANAATLGVPGINISSNVFIDDGLLDVFVIRRADLAELGSLMASVVGASNPRVMSSLPHWQCREVRIEADPPQGTEADGEDLGQTPVKVSLQPGALTVIVP